MSLHEMPETPPERGPLSLPELFPSWMAADDAYNKAVTRCEVLQEEKKRSLLQQLPFQPGIKTLPEYSHHYQPNPKTEKRWDPHR